jgi:hypothetical protein
VNTAVGRALLVAFVIVDLVLVVGTLNHVHRDPPPADIKVRPVAKPSVTPGAHSVAHPQYSFKPARAASASYASDGTIAYATRGQCDGDTKAKVVVSTDAGVSRKTSDTGLAEVLTVKAESRSNLRVVGAGADCTVQRLRSDDGGDTWTFDYESDLWFPDLTDPKKVITPSGPSKPGCTVTSLSQVGQGFARVSCSNGELRGTGDGTYNAGVALAVFNGCAAQEFTTRDGGRTWAPGGCISGEPAQAIAATDGGVAAVVDSQLYTSSDAGQSWSQP